jgi:class 3 adenylate cyclase
MTEFNSQVNRLVDPLRLRIGIHCGQTASSLQEVPYNELIDIAAHVEASAPVGGIAVTEQVVKYIEDEAVAEIKDEIDGHRVSIVLNPTNAA